MTVQILRQTAFVKGLWRNGRGISWDIASDGGPDDFGWRLALAEISADAPFSAYPGIDRVFTLVSGKGLDLDVAGRGRLAVANLFEPVRFPGDQETRCTLRGGACSALNLFLRRQDHGARVIIHDTAGPLMAGHDGTTLLFALAGTAAIAGAELKTGDAVRLTAPESLHLAPGAILYEAQIIVGSG